MEYYYSYFYNSSSNFEPKKLACEAGFIDEGGSAVPLPEELTKLFKPLECELCGVVVTSEVTAYTHYEGKVHMKNVNAFMKEQYNIYGSMKKIKVEFTPHQCEVCKCDLSSLIQAQQHYTGKVHKKNLRKINYDPQTVMALPTDLNCEDLGPDLLKDLPPPPPPPVLSDFICEICNITTNTEYQLIVHKNGSKHKRKVKKLKESFGDFGTDGFGFYTGDMLTESYVEAEACSSMEPIVTDYLPLSDVPLQFNINLNTQYSANQTPSTLAHSSNEVNDQAPLCIKWFNDKKEALPTRPLEDAWAETFSKTTEEIQIHALSTKASVDIPLTPSQGESSSIPSPAPDIGDIRTHEVPPEVANLPQFSVAAVLPQLQAPPSPPVGLINSALFDISDSTTMPSDNTSSCLELPRINFRETKIQPNVGCNESSMNESNENENKEEKLKISNLNGDPALTSNTVKTPSSPRTISFEITSIQNNLNMKTSNNERSSKSINNSEFKKNNEGNKGKFITTNWECSQDMNIDNENNPKKKKNIHFLFGFKKELGKKTTEDTKKNPDDKLQETSVPNESSKQIYIKDSIEQNKEIKNEKNGTICDKVNSNKEYNARKEKHSSDLKGDEVRKKDSDKKSEESKYSKGKSHSKYRKDRYEKDSHDHHRSKDSHKRHRDYKKHKDDYDRYTDSDDEDFRYERKKHRHSSRGEKESHRNKKPALAQPFVHKTSTKRNIIDYLAPASECDSNDIAMFRTPSGSYYCSKCDYKSKHSSDFTNHLFSRDHKEKKRNKTK